MQLGVATDAQIAQALAAHAGLPYVKINPLDLDLDVVTKAIAGPFARSNGIVAIDIDKNAKRITIAVHDPFAPMPWIDEIKRVTELDVDRVVATRDRHRGGEQGLLRPQVEPPARGEAAHREPRSPRWTSATRSTSPGPTPTSTPRPRPWSRPSTTSWPTPSSSAPPTSTSSPSATSPWCGCGSTGCCTTCTSSRRSSTRPSSRASSSSPARTSRRSAGPRTAGSSASSGSNGAANVRTTGGSATIVESKAGTNPFAPLSVGDTILVNDRSGTEQRRKVTARPRTPRSRWTGRSR